MLKAHYTDHPYRLASNHNSHRDSTYTPHTTITPGISANVSKDAIDLTRWFVVLTRVTPNSMSGTIS